MVLFLTGNDATEFSGWFCTLTSLFSSLLYICHKGENGFLGSTRAKRFKARFCADVESLELQIFALLVQEMELEAPGHMKTSSQMSPEHIHVQVL